MAKAFDKFVNKPVKGAKIKEAFRQEKKAAIKERREGIEKRFEEKRQQKQVQYEARNVGASSQTNGTPAQRGSISRNKSADKSQGPRAKSGGSTTGKTWHKTEDKRQEPTNKGQQLEIRKQSPTKAGWQKLPANRQSADSDNFKPKNRPSSGAAPQRIPGSKKTDSTNRSFAQRPSYSPKPATSGNPKIISDQSRNASYGKPFSGQKTENRGKRTEDKKQKPTYKPQLVDNKRENVDNKKPVASQSGSPVKKPFLPKNLANETKANPPETNQDQLENKQQEPSAIDSSRLIASAPKRIPPAVKYQSATGKKADSPGKKSSFTKKPSATTPLVSENMPLNKFLAHAGICSRRDAADKVRQGHASVNGTVITEPAFKVTDKDVVTFDGQKVHRSHNLVYILLNKPKDCITTSEDPQGRHTVMDIIRPATQERVYPVGRLDRNTSGVLLLTNDGDLAQQLSHPSYEVRKIYEVKLDKPVTKDDFDKIVNGITLEDGEIHADSLAYSDTKDRSVVGIEIHSGRNRIVRRMFEHLGYDVRGLDRVMYANLTKKNIERGHWRFLSEKEVRLLKYFNKSKKQQSDV